MKIESDNHYFVNSQSIVLKIWGNTDTILLIFAGASAEFALNKSVDWLYFTGKLPKDPLGRLFTTVQYAQKIVFGKLETAKETIESMNTMHFYIEQARGFKIPNTAYQDVLYMLIDYSIRAYEILERNLTHAEKQEVFDVFIRLGQLMNINDLPESFSEWLLMRKVHLMRNLQYSQLSKDLFAQYRLQLGNFRYGLLIEVYRLLTPESVQSHLKLKRKSFLNLVIRPYKCSKKVRLDQVFKYALLPKNFQKEIAALQRI